ncbi:hypothetical protein GH5_04815 [Leishmania sp. Ghana 2012 LV757]|uniref:hypothetical protein n=1 Tax=Leishmania sp. Ghana 2012 LV757 TaxID=2803181 RepID=UPI001B4884A9|nr:hypothetical protein GH5_04815 [Leishmania sp. Ghana 2012 LV757]
MAFWCCGADSASSVTSKNAAQLRSLEAMGLSRGNSPRLRRTEVQIPVTLNVYSLLESNKKLTKMGMGVFHTGVVVYGIEWGYGEVVDNPNASGLFCVHPGQAAGTLYRTIRIGHTTRSPMQVDTILHRLENEWRSSEYHILHHNCNHFAQAFCDLLSTTEKLQVPLWCNRAARVGDRVIPRRLATKVQHMMDDEPPKAVAPRMRTSTSHVSEVPKSVVPHEWYLHPSIFQPLRYVDESRPPSVGAKDEHVAATSEAAGGGGETNHSVEHNIVPPPGYELTGAASICPSTIRREVRSSTNENGNIVHMVAIEEQPSVTEPSRRDSARKLTASHPTAKFTPGTSPTLPPLGIIFSSGGDDRVVLPRVRISTSQPHSIAPSGSPQASELDLDVENVLHSEISEEMSPSVMSSVQIARSPSCAAFNLQRATPSGSPENWRQGASVEKEQTQQHQRPESNSRVQCADASTEKSAGKICDSVTQSAGVEATDDGGASAQPSSAFLAASHAMPIGCITTLSLIPSSPLAEEVTRRNRDMMVDEHDVSTGVANTSSEASNNTGGDLAPSKQKRSKQTTTASGSSSTKQERTRKKKSSSRFSDITGVPACDASLSSLTAAAAAPADVKHNNSSAWKLLKSQCGLPSRAGSGKAVRKYLSPPLPSGELSSSSPLSQPEGHRKDVASAAAVSGAAADAAVDVSSARRRETDPTHVHLSAISASLSPQSMHVSWERKGSGLDAVSHESQGANSTVLTPSTAALQNLPGVPNLDGNSPASTTELRHLPHNNTVQRELCRDTSAAEGIAELLPGPPQRRLSRSETPSAKSSASSSVGLPDLGPASPASPPMDSPQSQFSPSVVTPERPNVIASSRGATTGCSPAAAHRQCRRGSSSAAMSDTPLPQGKESRTPISSAQQRRCNDGNVAPTLRLDFGSDEVEPPLSSDSSRLSQTAGKAGTPLKAGNTTRTPIEPFPRLPSSLQREETPAGSAQAGQDTSSNDRLAASTAQRDLNTELESPAHFSQTPPESIPAAGGK